MNRPLFLLHLRRALHPGLALLFLGTTLFVLAGAPHGVRDVLQAGTGSAALARGLRRADLAFALLALLAPALLLQSALVFPRLERGERCWLLSRPLSRGRIALSTWAGGLTGALLWLVLVGLACEFAAGGGGPSWRAAGELELLTPKRGEGPEGLLSWRCESGPRAPGCLARLRLELFGSYNDVEAFELSARGAGAAQPFAEGSAAPNRLTRVEVALPAGDAALVFRLRAKGAQHPIVLNRPRLELFTPMAERMAIVHLLARVALCLAGALALARGLSAWISPPSTLLALLGGYVLVWLESDSLDGGWLARFLPGYGLPRALALVAQGRGPRAVGGELWLGAVFLVLVGLFAQRAALRRWRKGA